MSKVQRKQSRLRAMFDENVRFVTRTLKRAGVPESDLDDEIQRTFIVAAARLDDVQLGAERSFLYQVALNTAAHRRRTMARRREVLDGRRFELVDSLATPEQLTGRNEIRQLLDDVAACMGDSLYQVFKLFAYEEVDLPEIAKRLGVPRGTVASRLRRARAHLRRHSVVVNLASHLQANRPEEIEEPTTMSNVRTSGLMRVLLGAGASPRASASVRLETLVVLGFAERPKKSSRASIANSRLRRPRRPRSAGDRSDERTARLSAYLP